MALFISSLLQP